MHVLAAAILLAAWPCRLHAHAQSHTLVSRVLSVIGISQRSPINRLITCSLTIGPNKCVTVLSTWCAENAVDVISKGGKTQFNLTSDLEMFPWEKFRNTSDEITYSELCEKTEKMLQYRSLKLSVFSNFKLQLGSKGNGVLSLDILKDELAARSNKKLQEQFYNIVPYLLVPGLIMSAILPFVLPALKLMTVGAGMLNNMALTGAIFTLLRNNAFNDKYEHKLVYVNEGYENEKLYKPHNKHKSHNNPHEINGEYDDLEESSSSDWIKQYHRRKQEHLQKDNNINK